MQWRIQNGFSILLPVAGAIWMFGAKLNISYIATVPQAHRQPRLILNKLAKLDEGTPSVIDTKYREVAPESMQFGKAFHCIIQEIWEADPVQVPIRVSKLDIKDEYHHKILRLSQVGTSVYVISSAQG